MRTNAHAMPPSEKKLTDAIAGFCRFVRAQGFRIGVRETADALQVAHFGTLTDRRRFRLALRALLCNSKDEHDRFDTLFERYWHRDKATRPVKKQRPPRPATRSRQGIPLLMIGTENTATANDDEGKSTAGAHAAERLRTTDFSKVRPEDQEQLEVLALRLVRQMRLRLSRRCHATYRRQHVDLRRTIRRSVSRGGIPMDLRFRGRKPRKPRLAVFLDVSGSMDQYSFFLLRFTYALQHHFERVDTFLVSTRLQCINDVMAARRLPDSLAALADTPNAWSSGTRIGACLQTFNEDYARRVLTRHTLVLILSDGLDTGDPALLAREVRRIKERAQQVIWLNPLLGMEGYRPEARGIQAALPHVDAFLPAHNLESLLNLEAVF